MEYTYQNSHVLTCLSKCVLITWAKPENDVTLQTTDFASTDGQLYFTAANRKMVIPLTPTMCV
jgi:hypothetical protein